MPKDPFSTPWAESAIEKKERLFIEGKQKLQSGGMSALLNLPPQDYQETINIFYEKGLNFELIRLIDIKGTTNPIILAKSLGIKLEQILRDLQTLMEEGLIEMRARPQKEEIINWPVNTRVQEDRNFVHEEAKDLKITARLDAIKNLIEDDKTPAENKQPEKILTQLYPLFALYEKQLVQAEKDETQLINTFYDFSTLRLLIKKEFDEIKAKINPNKTSEVEALQGQILKQINEKLGIIREYLKVIYKKQVEKNKRNIINYLQSLTNEQRQGMHRDLLQQKTRLELSPPKESNEILDPYERIYWFKCFEIDQKITLLETHKFREATTPITTTEIEPEVEPDEDGGEEESAEKIRDDQDEEAEKPEIKLKRPYASMDLDKLMDTLYGEEDEGTSRETIEATVAPPPQVPSAPRARRIETQNEKMTLLDRMRKNIYQILGISVLVAALGAGAVSMAWNHAADTKKGSGISALLGGGEDDEEQEDDLEDDEDVVSEEDQKDEEKGVLDRVSEALGGLADILGSSNSYTPPPQFFNAAEEAKLEASKKMFKGKGLEVDMDDNTNNWIVANLLEKGAIDEGLVQEAVNEQDVIGKESVMKRFLLAAKELEVLYGIKLKIGPNSHFRTNITQGSLTEGANVAGIVGNMVASYHLLGQAFDIQNVSHGEKITKEGKIIIEVMKKYGFRWGIKTGLNLKRTKTIWEDAGGLVDSLLESDSLGEFENVLDRFTEVTETADRNHFQMSKENLSKARDIDELEAELAQKILQKQKNEKKTSKKGKKK